MLQQETAEAISNLANTTLADRQTMATMQATITMLTTQISEVNKVITNNVTVIDQMRAEVATYQETANRSNGAGRERPCRGGKYNGGGGDCTLVFTFLHYFWTHNPKCGYTSAQYTRCAEGHKEEAADTNKLGGRTTRWMRYGA